MIARRHFHLSLRDSKPQMTANNLPWMSTDETARELHLRLSYFYDDGCAWHISIYIIVTLTLIFDRIELNAERTYALDVDDEVKCIENYKLRCIYDSRKIKLYNRHKRSDIVHRRAAVQRQFAHNIITSILHTCRSCLRDICAKIFQRSIKWVWNNFFINSNFWCQHFDVSFEILRPIVLFVKSDKLKVYNV